MTRRDQSLPPHVRFWRNVDRRGEDECWPYGGFARYGRIRMGGAGSRIMQAHRYSYFLAYGHCPDGLVVMHKCDNPRCVNPKHLLLGTQADNAADMMSKRRDRGTFSPGPDSRRRVGESHPCSKLKTADIVAIRSDTRPDSAVAREYGVSSKLITMIKRRKAWAHV